MSRTLKAGVVYHNPNGHGLAVMSHRVEGLNYHIVRVSETVGACTRFITCTMTVKEIKQYLGISGKEKLIVL